MRESVNMETYAALQLEETGREEASHRPDGLGNAYPVELGIYTI